MSHPVVTGCLLHQGQYRLVAQLLYNDKKGAKKACECQRKTKGNRIFSKRLFHFSFPFLYLGITASFEPIEIIPPLPSTTIPIRTIRQATDRNKFRAPRFPARSLRAAIGRKVVSNSSISRLLKFGVLLIPILPAQFFL